MLQGFYTSNPRSGIYSLSQKHLRVINLDTRNRVINIEKLYVGSLNASTVRVGELFKPAIQRAAAAIIVLHNHPSGDPTPSPEDVALTRAIVQAGKLLDSEVTQTTTPSITFHTSIRLDTLPEDDLARELFAGAMVEVDLSGRA